MDWNTSPLNTAQKIHKRYWVLSHGNQGGINGSGITGYTLGDEEVIFDTVVGFANHRMVSGDTVETTTNGVTFTSTMLGLEPCQNNWSPMIGNAYTFL